MNEGTRLTAHTEVSRTGYASGWSPAFTAKEILDKKNYQAQLARKSILYIPSRIFVTPLCYMHSFPLCCTELICFISLMPGLGRESPL